MMEKFFISIGNNYKNCFNFNGVATRYEFWSWMLLQSFISYGLLYISIETETTRSLESTFGYYDVGDYLSEIYLLLIALPTWALTTRRVRAIGRNPLWVLFWAISIPMVSIINHSLFAGPTDFFNEYPANLIFILIDPITMFREPAYLFFQLLTLSNQSYAAIDIWFLLKITTILWLAFWELTHKNTSFTKKEVKLATNNPKFPVWLHYVGVSVAGYLVVSTVGFAIFGGTVPGLVGLLGILGGTGGVWTYRRGKKNTSQTDAMPPSLPSDEPKLTEAQPVEPDISSTHLVCLLCGSENPSIATHCISCGANMPIITCKKCQTRNLPEAKFCMYCGEKR